MSEIETRLACEVCNGSHPVVIHRYSTDHMRRRPRYSGWYSCPATGKTVDVLAAPDNCGHNNATRLHDRAGLVFFCRDCGAEFDAHLVAPPSPSAEEPPAPAPETKAQPDMAAIIRDRDLLNANLIEPSPRLRKCSGFVCAMAKRAAGKLNSRHVCHPGCVCKNDGETKAAHNNIHLSLYDRSPRGPRAPRSGTGRP